jgi:hypothetical protein
MSNAAEGVETAPDNIVSIRAATPAARRLHVVLAFFAIYVIWGSTYLAIRYAVETIPPLYAAGFRHLIAGSILLIWALAKGVRPLQHNFGPAWSLAFSSSCWDTVRCIGRNESFLADSHRC